MVVAVTSIGAFAVGLPWGAVGVAAAYGLSDLFIRAPIIWYWVGRRGPVATRDFVQLALPYATALAAIFTVDALLDERTLFSWPFIDLGARGLICYAVRSEEHTSEIQSLMRLSSAVFCLQINNPTKLIET